MISHCDIFGNIMYVYDTWLVFVIVFFQVIIIGGGICGLRVAIETALLGARTVVVEKRDRFSRNNVLHLWPFLITDLKNLGAKKFYGKFCAGAIDHISECIFQITAIKVL